MPFQSSESSLECSDCDLDSSIATVQHLPKITLIGKGILKHDKHGRLVTHVFWSGQSEFGTAMNFGTSLDVIVSSGRTKYRHGGGAWLGVPADIRKEIQKQ